MSQMAEIVFQLRVVADTPRFFSTTSLGYTNVRPNRRWTLKANLPVTPITFTCHVSPAGWLMGRGGSVRGRFAKTLTNRLTSLPEGSFANGSPDAMSMTSRDWQIMNSAVKGSL